MRRVSEIIASFLSREGFFFEPTYEEEVVHLHFIYSGPDVTLDCIWVCYDDSERICLFSVFPLDIVEPKRSAVAEYMTRVNHGLLIGNFEINLDTGVCRYKTSCDLEGMEPADTFLRNLLAANLSSTSRYFPGLLKVYYSGAAPSDAVAALRQAH